MRTRIPQIAKNLTRFVDAYGYAEWIHHITRDFEFDDLMQGLRWLANSSCPGCFNEGGMPRCEVRACCQGKEKKNCYFCEEFSRCEKLSYQKETYDIDENRESIKQIGYAGWLKSQAKKTSENFDNITYLEKKREK